MDKSLKELANLADCLLDIAYEIEINCKDLNLKHKFPTEEVIRFASELLLKSRGL